MTEPKEPRDPPIEALDYIGGVKVVDIGDLRVARGLTRRAYSGCGHRRLIYDNRERRVWCKDCETTVEAFDAFEMLVLRYDSAFKDLGRRSEALDHAEKFQARSLAVKELDKAWRTRGCVPACPHCRQGLFPEDFKKGVSTMDRDYAEALLKRRKDSAP